MISRGDNFFLAFNSSHVSDVRREAVIGSSFQASRLGKNSTALVICPRNPTNESLRPQAGIIKATRSFLVPLRES